MFEYLNRHADGLYAIAFFGAMALVLVWETMAARRRLNAPLRTRWTGNILIYIIGASLNRILFPGLVIGVALWSTANHWGLFSRLAAPPWLILIISLIVLDLSRYLAHWMFHTVPLFWRLHSMHHTDQDYDLTTSFRFHPLEVIVQFVIAAGTITLLGAPVAAVILSEVVSAFSAIVVHGNIRIPLKAEAVLRIIFVTPDMHRVHHSTDETESASNFSSIFSWWDRLFGTYIPQPGKGHEDMAIGLKGYEDLVHLKLARMLIHPFLAPLHSEISPTSEKAGADVRLSSGRVKF